MEDFLKFFLFVGHANGVFQEINKLNFKIFNIALHSLSMSKLFAQKIVSKLFFSFSFFKFLLFPNKCVNDKKGGGT